MGKSGKEAVRVMPKYRTRPDVYVYYCRKLKMRNNDSRVKPIYYPLWQTELDDIYGVKFKIEDEGY